MLTATGYRHQKISFFATLILLLGAVTLFSACLDIFKTNDTEKIPKGEYHFVNETDYQITINIHTPFRENYSGSEKTGSIALARQQILYSSYDKVEFDWSVNYKLYSPSPNNIWAERAVPVIRGSKVTFMYYSNAKRMNLLVPSSNSLLERIKFNEEYWGAWITVTGPMYISGMDIFYIDNADVHTGVYMNNPVIKRLSPNVIKISTSDGIWDDYFFTSRIPNGSFNGRVVSNSTTRSADDARAISGLGSIDVVVSNLNNNANAQNTRTDGNGNFEVDNVIPGDTYVVIVDDKSVPVISNTINEDIGNVTIKDGVNFKASIRGAYSLFSDGYEFPENINALIINKNYYVDIFLSIMNANVYNGQCQYQLTLPSGITSTSALSGSFNANEDGIKIPINLTCLNVNNEYEYKKIGVQITANRMTWEDSVSMRFYRETIRIYFYDNHQLTHTEWVGIPLSFMVRTPHGDTFTTIFGLQTDEGKIHFIEVPKCSGGDYLIALFNLSGDYDDENFIYNLSVDQFITPNFDGLTTDYNSGYDAKTIAPNDIVRYKRGDEPVFYKFRF